jgi:uncharacterized protein (TIGR00369 family)
MKYQPCKSRVSGAQNISRRCFVCGGENTMGLHAQFYELEDGRLVAEFTAADEHQSYPGRVHGGVISAILDETIGRAMQVADPDIFGVTLELNVRFRKPVPLGVPLRVVAKITEHSNRMFAGEGVLLLEDDSVAAQATARYLRMDVGGIVEGGLSDMDWHPDERKPPKAVTV